jgi:hypothetical protein
MVQFGRVVHTRRPPNLRFDSSTGLRGDKVNNGGNVKKLAVLSAVVVGLAITAVAFAGSPHFIKSDTSATVSGNTLTVSGKEAGLGDEDQIHIEITATALCINPGGHHPKAVNKQDVTGGGDFPVQNGKANFSISVTATFQPDCTPPMTVDFTNIVVTDTTNGLTLRL